MKILRVMLQIACIGLFFGFRSVSDKRWEVSVEEPTIWIELDEKLYANDGFGDKIDDLKGEMASLKDVAPELQRIEIWKMILRDFDNVKTSFLRLRLKPGQIDEIDAENTENYDETYAQNHTMSIVVGSSRGLASGFASPDLSGDYITGCKIVIAPTTLKDPLFFKHVLTHEMMHCLGFKHQQEDSDSLMSYANNSPSLSLEERMGLTHLYPTDPSYGKEMPTFGLACTPAK